MNKTALILLLFFSLCLHVNCNSQIQDDINSLKIRKQQTFVKAAFDESEYKLIAFDKYGNPYPNSIKSFTIYYKENDIAYETKSNGNVFSEKTIDFLTKKKKFATKICLTNITAENAEGHLEKIPDLCDIVIFPDCKKVKHK